MSEVTHDSFDFDDWQIVDSATFKDEYLVQQKVLRLLSGLALGFFKDAVTRQGKEPNEGLGTYIERRLEQRAEIAEVAKNRYILEKQLGSQNSRREIDRIFTDSFYPDDYV